MGLSITTLALARKYAQKKIDIAVEEAVERAKAYTDEVVSEFVSFSIEIVEVLPDPSEAKEHVIYFVHRESPSGGADYYYEYIWINNSWELIGSTELDLSNYWTIDEVKEYVRSQGYVLPIASSNTLGGVKIDDTSIQISQDGTISIIDTYIEGNTQDLIDANFEYITNNDINNLFN